MPESWAETIVVQVPRVQCPYCFSPDWVRSGTKRRKNGDLERWMICKVCSRRYRWRVTKLFPVGESLVRITDRSV